MAPFARHLPKTPCRIAEEPAGPLSLARIAPLASTRCAEWRTRPAFSVAVQKRTWPLVERRAPVDEAALDVRELELAERTALHVEEEAHRDEPGAIEREAEVRGGAHVGLVLEDLPDARPVRAHEPVAVEAHERLVVGGGRDEASALGARHGGHADAPVGRHGRDGTATATAQAGQTRRACSTPQWQRVKRASRSARGSGSRASRSKTLREPREGVVGEDIGPQGGVRELHVAAQDAVACLGAAQQGGVRRVRAAVGVNEEERREEHHRERVEVRLARERAACARGRRRRGAGRGSARARRCTESLRTASSRRR